MRLILSCVLIILFLFLPSSSSAHFGGISAVKVNGVATDVYTTEEYALIGDETVPADIASGKYLVNKSITLEVDKSRLPVTDEVLENTTYIWDFGDGKKKQGASVKHIYTKARSYVVNLEINYGSQENLGYTTNEGMGSDPQSQKAFQSILIHVLPNANYKVPFVKFIIDGKKINDPVKERPEFDFENKFLFFKFPKAVTYSVADSSGTSKIVSYLWDFGDGSVSNKAKLRHRFREKYYFYTVGLKVTDEKGFSTYSIVNLADKKAFEENVEEN